jgi:hypothetical protein
MKGIAIALVVYICFFGGALLGMLLSKRLPEHHLSDESKQVVQAATATVGTVAGLVLGLLVASATSSYNTQRSNVIELSARVALLDRLLAHYGPQAADARASLKSAAQASLAQIWPNDRWQAPADAFAPTSNEDLLDRLEDLTPRNDRQTSIKNMALGVALELGRMRWLMREELTKSVSLPLIVVLTFWFTAIFLGLGIFARRNATTVTALGLSALALTGAIYLMTEMYAPFQGLLQIPSTPLQNVIAILGK